MQFLTICHIAVLNLVVVYLSVFFFMAFIACVLL